MATILFLPYAYQLGSTYPLIDLAKHFSNKGDNVIFAGEGGFMRLVKSSGFKTLKLIEVPYAIYDANISKGQGGFHNYKSVKEFVRDELALYEKIKPDLIISQNRPTVRISAQIANIKHVAVIVSLATKYRGMSFHHAESFTYHELFKLPLIGKILDKNADSIINLIARMWLPPYNKVLKEYKQQPIHDFFDLVEGNLMTLIPESPALFPLKAGYPQDKYFYIGPQLKHSHFKHPDWYNEAKNRDGYFIYLSMGSTTQNIYPYVYRKLVEIFGGRKDINVISNTSWILNGEEEHKNSPENIFVANITPAEIMFKLADLTICHGGNGTIYHSLMYGVPVMGIVERAEHEMNMRRIKELDLGDFISFKKFKTISNAEIESKIIKLLQDKKTHENVIQTAKVINNQIAQIDGLVEFIRKQI